MRTSCAECHLNKQTDRLSGHQLRNTPPEFGAIYSANITGAPATGLGQWTPAQLAGALRFRQSPHDPVYYPMPKYPALTDEEVQGIYAYLQSVPKLRAVAAK